MPHFGRTPSIKWILSNVVCQENYSRSSDRVYGKRKYWPVCHLCHVQRLKKYADMKAECEVWEHVLRLVMTTNAANSADVYPKSALNTWFLFAEARFASVARRMTTLSPTYLKPMASQSLHCSSVRVSFGSRPIQIEKGNSQLRPCKSQVHQCLPAVVKIREWPFMDLKSGELVGFSN
jgi:hypothetical protein